MLNVHVIGGGGTAAPVLAKLIKKGYSLSCGVLIDGDADQEVAEALDIPYISQLPFSHITEESHVKHVEILNKSDIVVLTDMPIGNGNILNVEAANDAACSGKKVVLLKPDLVSDRDFTGGEASQLFVNMLKSGALHVETIDELVSLLDTFDIN